MRQLWMAVAAIGVALPAAGVCQQGALDPTFPDRDMSVRPGESFDRYANGRWLARPFRVDRSSESVYVDVQEGMDEKFRSILEETAPTNPELAHLRALYASFMDKARIEALSDRPLLADLALLRRLNSHSALAGWLAKRPSEFGTDLFELWVDSDLKSPRKHAAYLSQGRLGLPDRAYYLDERYARVRSQYPSHVEALLTRIGWPDASRAAQDVVAFETALARYHWTRAESRENSRTYNPHSITTLQKEVPAFPWREWAGASGAPGDRIILVQDSAIIDSAKLFTRTPIETLKAWAAFRMASDASNYLSSDYSDLRFNFYGRTISGQAAQAPRSKQGIALVNDLLGEALGRIYVKRHFSPEAKVEATALVGEVRAALRRRLQRASWVSEETRGEALAKIDAGGLKVGYPDNWRSYVGLELRRDDLYGNVKRARAFEHRYELSKLRKAVDPLRWNAPPQGTSAFYDPTLNEIIIPAGRLQPPFFSAGGDPAVNYGGIGAVIGHELSHGYDDQGRDFDSKGELRDWWLPTDAKAFEAKATMLAEQFSALEVLPGFKLNGRQVLGEALGDLVGLQAAYDAWRASPARAIAQDISGLSPDQRFFLSYARTRRERYRDEALRQRAATAVHPPGRYRIEQTVRNLDPWYEAFGVTSSDRLWLPPEKRVRIW